MADCLKRGNSTTFTNAARELLTILCQWPSCDVKEGGITLELGVYSPSDSRYGIRDFHLEEDYPYHEISDLDDNYQAYKDHAARLSLTPSPGQLHRCVHGHQLPPFTFGSVIRQMGPVTYKGNRYRPTSTKSTNGP
ncbi:hypothetical protein GE09DRAFT_360297 [Coniochaeta sp. 2T2.1]|nr:hypothetical protein GE09DRAFT_360297 [Coniochaeta sp. 2T2.1]